MATILSTILITTTLFESIATGTTSPLLYAMASIGIYLLAHQIHKNCFSNKKSNR